jgi:hypothetical protein
LAVLPVELLGDRDDGDLICGPLRSALPIACRRLRGRRLRRVAFTISSFYCPVLLMRHYLPQLQEGVGGEV